MALSDICYYVKTVKEAGIKAGRFVEARPGGSAWTDAEDGSALAVWRNANIDPDELDHLKTGKKRVSHHGGRGTLPKLVNVPSKEWPAVATSIDIDEPAAQKKKPSKPKKKPAKVKG